MTFGTQIFIGLLKKGIELAVGSASCSCGGKNKNCFTCLVSGNVKPAEPEKPAGRTRTRIVHTQKLNESLERGREPYAQLQEQYFEAVVPIVCKDCGVVVKNLEKHRIKVHGILVVEVDGASSKLETSAKSSTSPLFTLKKCPVCSSMVGDLAKHMKKADHLNEAKRRTRLVLQAETGEMICPFCPSRWPNRREVTAHVDWVHGKHAKAELRFALPRRPIL